MGLVICLDYMISTKGTKYAYKGADQVGSSSSVEVTEKNWQDQVDGVSDKWKDGDRKTVRFGGARRIHEERKDEEDLEENAVDAVTVGTGASRRGRDVGRERLERTILHVTAV